MDKALKAGGFSAHVIGVSEGQGYQCPQSGEQYDFLEVVLKLETQVLPLAVLYIKDAAEAAAERAAVSGAEDALDAAVRSGELAAVDAAVGRADALGIHHSQAYQSARDALQHLRAQVMRRSHTLPSRADVVSG